MFIPTLNFHKNNLSGVTEVVTLLSDIESETIIYYYRVIELFHTKRYKMRLYLRLTSNSKY